MLACKAGSQIEPVVPGSDSAKGVAGGLHDVARNEPLRKAGSLATAVRTTASEQRRDGCGWLLFEYRQRRQAPDTSSRRDGAVDCRTAGCRCFCASVRRSIRLIISVTTPLVA